MYVDFTDGRGWFISRVSVVWPCQTKVCVGCLSRQIFRTPTFLFPWPLYFRNNICCGYWSGSRTTFANAIDPAEILWNFSDKRSYKKIWRKEKQLDSNPVPSTPESRHTATTPPLLPLIESICHDYIHQTTMVLLYYSTSPCNTDPGH